MNLDDRFTYHPPASDQRVAAHEAVRNVLLQAAQMVQSITPEGREQSLAITKLEEAMFWGNAALARSPQ